MTIAADLETTLTGIVTGKFWPSVAQRPITVPYGIYQTVSTAVVTDLDGMSENRLTNTNYQIDIFGLDKLVLDGLADAVMSAMDGATLFDSICTNRMDGFEDAVNLHRVTLEFSVWHSS